MSLLPLLKCSHIQIKSVCEILAYSAGTACGGRQSAWRRIIDDPTLQFRLAVDVGENLAKPRFDVPSELGEFHAHRPAVLYCSGFSILIARRPDRPRRSRVSWYFVERQGTAHHSIPATGHHANLRAEPSKDHGSRQASVRGRSGRRTRTVHMSDFVGYKVFWL